MLSDIAESHCSDKRVKHGMDKHIGIGMTEKPVLIRDIHPAYYQLSAGVETVYIVAVTDFYIRDHAFSPSFLSAR